MELRYILNGSSLELDTGKCIGCGLCVDVCPHAVFTLADGKAEIARRARCMECGACDRNCPAAAIAVKAGVGCAAAIIGKMIGKPGACGCGPGTTCC